MIRARVAVLAIALAGAACLVAPPAAAEPTAEERNAARSMLLEGYRHMEGRDPKRALELFRAADSVMNVPTTRWAIATALDKLGRLVEEEALLTELLKQPAKLDDPPAFLKARSDARAKLAEVTRRIAEIHVEGPPGQIAIDGAVSSGASTRVNPGKHVVALTAAGKGDVKEAIVVVSDGEKRTVRFDGAGVSTSPAALPVGAPATSGGDGDAAQRPAESSVFTRPLVLLGFGLGVVGVTAGTLTGILAAKKKSDTLDRFCDGERCPSEANAGLDSAQTLATVSTISFIVSAVGVGIGIVGIVSSPSSPSSPASPASSKASPASRPAASLVVGPANLGLRGTF